MPIDMDDAMRSGAVSAKAAKKHGRVGVHGPRAKPSTHMMKRQKDEGHVHNDGLVATKGHINARELQHTGKGMPSKGGGVGARAHNTPEADAIDSFPRGQARKFPAGTDTKGRAAATPMSNNTRMKGTIPARGGYYGGGGQNTQ